MVVSDTLNGSLLGACVQDHINFRGYKGTVARPDLCSNALRLLQPSQNYTHSHRLPPPAQVFRKRGGLDRVQSPYTSLAHVWEAGLLSEY
jgi:hypothetical protein